MQKCYEWPTLGWQLWCEQMFGGLCLITWLHISQSQQNILQHSQHWHSHTLCLISISNHNYEEWEWMWNIYNLHYVFKLCIFYKLPSWLRNCYYPFLLLSVPLYNVVFTTSNSTLFCYICDVHRSGCICYTCEYCEYCEYSSYFPFVNCPWYIFGKINDLMIN